MNYYLRHNKTKERVEIEALSFSVEKHLYVFYCVEDGKVFDVSFNTYNWDLINNYVTFTSDT